VQERNAAALLSRIQIRVAPELTAKYPAAWPAHLEVELSSGEMLSAGGDFPRGNAENPVSTAELEAKFIGLVSAHLGHAAATGALALIRQLEDIPDMGAASRTLNDLMSRPQEQP
jgi:2-methylcitrate dehydratase PrpD